MGVRPRLPDPEGPLLMKLDPSAAESALTTTPRPGDRRPIHGPRSSPTRAPRATPGAWTRHGGRHRRCGVVACSSRASAAPRSQRSSSTGSGTSSTARCGPAQRRRGAAGAEVLRTASAATGGAPSAATRCHRSISSPIGSTLMVGVIGTQSPSGSATASTILVCVATRTLGRSRPPPTERCAGARGEGRHVDRRRGHPGPTDAVRHVPVPQQQRIDHARPSPTSVSRRRTAPGHRRVQPRASRRRARRTRRGTPQWRSRPRDSGRPPSGGVSGIPRAAPSSGPHRGASAASHAVPRCSPSPSSQTTCTRS